MRTHKTLCLIGFLFLFLMISSYSSLRKSRKSIQRYDRERCYCSRLNEPGGSDKVYMIEWAMHHGGEKGSE